MTPKKIAPSILSANFGYLALQIIEAEQAGADLIHIDVMDGHFVPNITFGSPIVKAARQATSLPLDVHLMIENPEHYIEIFAKAGADNIIFHPESTKHPHRLIQMIKENNCKVGMALNPLTPIEYLRDALPYLDIALIMSVNPGFGGQKFIEASIERVQQLSKIRNQLNPGCEIEIDGGVKAGNIRVIADAGVDILVAGSEVYSDGRSVKDSISRLRKKIV